MNRIAKAAALVGVIAITATGCGSYMSTDPQEAGLHYKGGPFSATKFANCQSPSEKHWVGPGDKKYNYPAGQRTFSFTGQAGSEKPPLAVTTSDNQQVTVPGFITFHLDTSCDSLRQFHEQIGLKYGAYMKDDQTSEGWGNMLNDYMFVPLQTIANSAAHNFGWQQLYNDSSAVTSLSDNIDSKLQSEIDSAMGGHYLIIEKVNLGRPDISDELKAGNAEIQRAKLDQQAQEQRNKVYHDKYDTFADCQKVLSQENCLLFYAIEHGNIHVVPVPEGLGINLNTN